MPNSDNSVFSKLPSFQALIPQFDSVSSVTPQYFVDTVTKITDSAKCSPEEKLMVMKSRIRGEALTHVINSPDLSQETDFLEFCNKFTKFFDNQDSLAMRQHHFSNTKMLPNESVKIYAARVAASTQKFFGNVDFKDTNIKALLEQTKLAKFLEGLVPEFKKVVMTRDPQTLQEALNFVEILQANESMFPNTSVNNTSGHENNEIKQLLQIHAQQTHETVAALSKELENLKLNRNFPENRTGRFEKETHFTDSRQNGLYGSRSNGKRFTNNTFNQNHNSNHNSVRCQICNRTNHTASRCFYRLTPQGHRTPNNGFPTPNRLRNFPPRSERPHSNVPRSVRFQTPHNRFLN